MKKITIFIIIILVLPFLPMAGHCNYAIHLKNGGRFLTPHYWEQGQEILFYTNTGVLGIEKQSVRKIEMSDEVLRTPPSTPVAETVEAPEENESIGETVEEELDIEAYQAKMDKLKAALNRTLGNIKIATETDDEGGLSRAREENRAISAEMYRLTDELRGKNQGELPPNWWDGIGREEESSTAG